MTIITITVTTMTMTMTTHMTTACCRMR
jgi:hypothetical protein